MQNPQSILSQITSIRDAAYAEGKVRGKSGKEFNVWPTGLTADAGYFLRDLVISEQAFQTLETGLAFGFSSMFILEGAISAHLKSQAASARKIEHVAIDPYQQHDWDSIGTEMIRRCGLESSVRVYEVDSTLQLPQLVRQNERFDFGFIDGGHNYELVFLDIFFMHRLVSPGGLIVVDDIWMPAIQAAVAFFTTNCGTERLHVPSDSPGKRFAVLRTPTVSIDRAWDHFVPFWNIQQ